MSIASVSSSSFREQQLCGFKRQQQQQQQREQPEQHFEQQHPQQQQLLESVNRHKERVRNASLRVEVLECQIREEVDKLISLVGSSCSHSALSNPSSHHNIDIVDDNNNNNNNNNPNIHQLESHLLQLENDLLTEQRTLAEYETSYQVSLERTKQRWKQQIEEHQRRFRVCYRAVPQHSRTKSL